MKYLISAILLAFTLGSPTQAEDMVLENFKSSPETRWRFVSDQVMGGVSQGQVSFIQESDTSFAHMTGTVSLENETICKKHWDNDQSPRQQSRLFRAFEDIWNTVALALLSGCL